MAAAQLCDRWTGRVSQTCCSSGDTLAVAGLTNSTKLRPGVILTEMTVDCVRASKRS